LVPDADVGRSVLPRIVPPADRREQELEAASAALVASLPKRAVKKTSYLSRAGIEEIAKQAEEMRALKDFSRAGPRHLVALWGWLHEQTYGVAPSLTSREWVTAGYAAGTLLARDFGGKVEAMVDFMRWTWAEERRSVKWKRENARPVTPLGWRWQFSSKAVVKWRANGGGT
jgi:hypothetical protein